MSNRFPIYDLLHQEIRACATHLLELCKTPYLCAETEGPHILSRLKELHDFSQKIYRDNHYHPLFDLQHYLENTMLPFSDEQQRDQSIRLSEAVSLLAKPPIELSHLDEKIVRSLRNHCIRHFQEEIQPGRRLHGTLKELKALSTI